MFKKFTEIRRQNWDKIDEYYIKLAAEYRAKQQQYDIDSASTDTDKAEYARYIAPQLQNYRTQMSNVLSEMVNLMDKNDVIIVEQKKIIDKLTSESDVLVTKLGDTATSASDVPESGFSENHGQMYVQLQNTKRKYWISISIIIVLAVILLVLLWYKFIRTQFFQENDVYPSSLNATNL
jgi:hypothetical protein